MKRLLLILLLCSLLPPAFAQGGIINATRQQKKASQPVAQSAQPSAADQDDLSVLHEVAQDLGIADDTTNSTSSTLPTLTPIPESEVVIGWIPEPTNRLVNDFTGIFSQEQVSALEQRLRDCWDSCRVEIALLVVPNLGGDAIESFAQNVWNKWHIGNKEKNNGVLVVVKPKNSTDGQVRIHTGYGMEGALPDAFCSRIINDQMIPHFSSNDYYGGIEAALDIIIPVAKGEYSLEQYQEDNDLTTGEVIIILLFIGGIIILLFWAAKKGASSGSTGGFSGTSSWSGSSSSWSSGSSSGGGFGGFGGGFSGGGGASGRW